MDRLALADRLEDLTASLAEDSKITQSSDIAQDSPAPSGSEAANDPADLILDAASRRFLHYGYGKTTMSEIAKDCDMSTGNLYRFFPSKLDIAEAFVKRLRNDQMRKLRAILDEDYLKADDQLRKFLRRKFQLAFDRFHNRPKAFELSAEILTERPSFAGEWERAEADVLIAILNKGEKEGLFVIPDKRRTARIIQDAVFRFTTSAVFHEGDCDALASELDEVTDLILDAFAFRKMAES